MPTSSAIGNVRFMLYYIMIDSGLRPLRKPRALSPRGRLRYLQTIPNCGDRCGVLAAA
jgi:hypothetical protein